MRDITFTREARTAVLTGLSAGRQRAVTKPCFSQIIYTVLSLKARSGVAQ